VGCLGTDLGEQSVSFLTATTGDYCEFLSHPQRRGAFDDGVLAGYGLGAEAYKEWFANSTRENVHAVLTKSPVRHWREMAQYRLATDVKRFPKLEAAIRNARSRLGM
jgi:hypothetical protein